MGALRLSAMVAAVCAFSACNQYTTCDVNLEDSKRDDGGVYRCARPEDCPRTPNTFVCTTDDDRPSTECVSCTASTCLRHIPVKCQ